MVHCSPMVLFTPDVKRIKAAAYKNYDVDGTYKQAFKLRKQVV